MREDLETIMARDPSIHSAVEALFHSTLPAVWLHRAAHRLHRAHHRVIARALTNLARVLTGVELHPGATVGRRFFIDHGTGVVIGETAVIGDDVTIYQQVTLGAVGWWRDVERPPGARRHPRVGDRCVFGAGAQVLGPVTIGDDVLICATSLVVTDVAPGDKVVAAPAVRQEDVR
ncbi:serine O-acetyltransferase [Amycolatopsis bartoniae]|nr:serine O-acetyltransferase EpsC [Amycolatopsis bartoniae]MBB2940203.1 serine O-acetyltransferase [Amycolatopsis bartoniae]TVT11294.1 serine acetyltransferase [Amycolatopsis bartoniae]